LQSESTERIKVKRIVILLVSVIALLSAAFTVDATSAQATKNVVPTRAKDNCPKLTKEESHGRLVSTLKKAHGLTAEGKAVLHGKGVAPGVQVLATDFPSDVQPERTTQSRSKKSTISYLNFYCGIGVGVQALWITSPGSLLADGFWSSYVGATGRVELGVNNCPFYASSCLVSLLWDVASWRSADAVRLFGSPYVIEFFDKWCVYA
jgi:hypothetical protein